MYLLAVMVALSGLAGTTALLATEEKPPHTTGFNERLNEALGTEGGVQVYVDPAGNIGTVIDPPGGERRVNVQPPPSPSRNLGPPLQLHNPLPDIPQRDVPSQPPVDDFLQNVR
jgi:hypothetical protein